ncbi:MAG: PLP-dependent aspartate aminotransferase family protein [Phycisphaerales bacterium]|jgi:cystathionine gamma-lyase|nr:PLP-dependent aspartate aminotransferase family protein [Phycisphaerales bacterium]
MTHIKRFDSKVIHAGQSPEQVTGAVMPPVFLSSTFVQESPGVHSGFEYTRSHNPTRYALERCIARLEGSELVEEDDASFGGFAFSSGMAAIGALLELLNSGDHIVAMDDLYGGTHRLFSQVRTRSAGLEFSHIDLSNTDDLVCSIQENTKLIWIETPTNPTLKLVDLKAIVEIAKDRGILLACDNTFATPAIQQPLELGFDIVMHSGTKYIGGHSDVVCGLLVTAQKELAERIRFIQNSVGSVLGPFDSYLALRGIKTLGLRMRRHCESALRIASWLEQHSAIDKVIYPGLPSHGQYEIAKKQMTLDGKIAGGGMITCILHGGLDASCTFLEKLNIFALAESLGGVESLVEHPAIMTHASVSPEMRTKLGIDDGLVRISVGIEDCEDLLEDLEQALS